MATNTRTVTVYDMATGAVLRTTTTAGEAQRAQDPTTPFYGLTMTDILWERVNNKRKTQAQRAQRAKRNAKRAQELALAEMQAYLAEAQSEADTRDAHKAERANGNGVTVTARDYDGTVLD